MVFLMEFRKSKTAVVIVVCLALFVDMVIYGVVIPTLPTLVKKRMPDVNPSQIGFLFASYAIGLLAITPIIGVWSDKHNNRKFPMLIGMLGLAVATVLFAYGQNFLQLLLARMGQGVAGGVSWTIGLCMIADIYPSHQLGEVMSRVLSFNTLGFLVGPPIGGLLFTYFSAETPYLFCAALALIDLFARLFIKPSKIKKEHLAEEVDVTTALLDESNNNSQTQNNLVLKKPASIIQLMKDPQLIVTCMIVLIGATIFSGIEPTLPIFLETKFFLEPNLIGVIFCCIIVPNMISSLIFGKLSDKFGRKNISFIGLILNGLAAPLVGYSFDLPSLIIFLGLFGITTAIIMTPTLAEMAEIVERLGGGANASVYALYNVSYSIGMMVGPILGGWIVDTYGFKMQMIFFGLLSFLFSPIVLIAWYKQRVSRNGYQEISN